MAALSVATANFYFLPFQETLDIIAEAGFHYIELDLFWEWKMWSMAQHLQEIPVSQAIQSIHRSGLIVNSIHDGGGVLNYPNSAANYINPKLDEFLDLLGYAPQYMVFHPPHAEGNWGPAWWNEMSDKILDALAPYRDACSCLALENMPLFEGFTVPLTTPEELYDFTSRNELGINLDTTHYAQINVDIKEAASVLRSKIHSIHLSDYSDRQTHVYVGEGCLDLDGFMAMLDPSVLHTVTLECSVSSPLKSVQDMGHAEIVDRMKRLKIQVERWI